MLRSLLKMLRNKKIPPKFLVDEYFMEGIKEGVACKNEVISLRFMDLIAEISNFNAETH
jgi:hypothetical protein